MRNIRFEVVPTDTNPEENEYIVQRLLGESNYKVYEVIDIEGNHYALKNFEIFIPEYQIEAEFRQVKHKFLAVPEKYGRADFYDGEDSKPTRVSFTATKILPNGTLHDFLENECKLNEDIAKYMCRQLVDAVEYLHSEHCAHLDIKPENIMFDENYNLHLIDFEGAYMELLNQGDLSYGTKDYRALELSSGKYNPYPADIFSLGIVFFILYNGILRLPFAEAKPEMYKQFNKDNHEYWKRLKETWKADEDIWSPEFKELFFGMARVDPEKRLKIEEVKGSHWLQGVSVSEPEYLEFMKNSVEASRE
jgi:serine/threonine protein kinase